ncbi:MAG: FAD:protein FMN transferase [Maribacter sp.]|nr:FAD:protein FMN transferase [Maribacter sp.]
MKAISRHTYRFYVILAFFYVSGMYAQNRYEFQYRQMGTEIRLILYTSDQIKADSIAHLAFNRIDELNAIFSDYRSDSELNKLCERPNEDVRVSDDLFAIIKTSLEVSRLTQGAFDITAGPIVRLWRTARQTKTMPSDDEIRHLRKRVGFKNIGLTDEKTVRLKKKGMQLDLGGIGKGYTADEVLKVLEANDIHSALIDMGGDIRVSNPPPNTTHWIVAFSYINSSGNEIVQKLHLKNQAIATSGDLYQFVDFNGIRYSHIVDPNTGWALSSGIQVTTLACNATLADAYASALSVWGMATSKVSIGKLPILEAFLVQHALTGNRLWHTDGFENYLVD